MALMVASTAARARPLPPELKSTIKAGIPYVERSGVAVRLTQINFPDRHSEVKAIELSDDGKDVVVRYSECGDDPITAEVPLTSIEAYVENSLGMALHLKKDYAGAIAHFTVAAAKDLDTPLYATNLLSAQSMGGKLDDADRTLATYGAKNIVWFAWRLQVDPELAALKRRPSTSPFAAAAPGHAQAAKLDFAAYSPMGGGITASRLGEVVFHEVATGRELARLDQKAADRVFAALGFEPLPKPKGSIDDDKITSLDGKTAFKIGAQDFSITVGGHSTSHPSRYRVIDVAFAPDAVLVEHNGGNNCGGDPQPATIELVRAPGITVALPKPATVDCGKLVKQLTAKLEQPNSACVAGSFGAPAAFVWRRWRAEGILERYELVRGDGSVFAALPAQATSASKSSRIPNRHFRPSISTATASTRSSRRTRPRRTRSASGCTSTGSPAASCRRSRGRGRGSRSTTPTSTCIRRRCARARSRSSRRPRASASSSR